METIADGRCREEAERTHRARGVAEPGRGSGRACHGSSWWVLLLSHLGFDMSLSHGGSNEDKHTAEASVTLHLLMGRKSIISQTTLEGKASS